MLDFEAALNLRAPIGSADEYRDEPYAVLDVDRAKARLADYRHQVDGMLDQARKHGVNDSDSMAQAVEMASQAKKLFQAIEKARKGIVDAPNAFVKAINTFTRQFTDKLAGIETELKAKMSRFQIEQEKERLEAQQKAQEEARQLQEALNQKAALANESPVQIVTPLMPETSRMTRTESGSAGLRRVWSWREIDFGQVPDEYKKLDEVKINQAVKAGMRVIPGIEIFEEAKTVIRTA